VNIDREVPTEDMCLHVDDLLDGYVLDALDARERAFVEEYIFGCPEQVTRLIELEDVTGMLGMALPPERPPRDLWPRLAAATGAAPAPVTPALAPVPLTAAARPSNVVFLNRWLAWGSGVAAALLLASTVALAVALQREQADDEGNTVDDPVAAYVANGGRVTPLNTEKLPPGMPSVGRGSVIVADDMAPMLVVDRCTPSSEGVTYIVWLGAGDSRTVLGEMEIGTNGRGMMPIENMTSFEGYDTIGISIKMKDDPALHDVMLGTPPSETA
jgi:hypothetical protein